MKNKMSFLDHLEALRWHLIRAVLAICLLGIVIFIYQNWVYNNVLLAHLNPDFISYRFMCELLGQVGFESGFCNIEYPSKLQSLSPTTQFMNALWSSILLGFFFSFPYIVWEFWRFIKPGLKTKEQKNTRGFIFFTSLLFSIGLLFSYFVICPMSVYFFYNYSISDFIINNFQFNAYINLILNTSLGLGIVFELPVLIYFLTKIGLITPTFLKKYRKQAFVITLILSAIITPPDIASQIIVTIPLIFLYEVGIWVSNYSLRKDNLV